MARRSNRDGAPAARQGQSHHLSPPHDPVPASAPLASIGAAAEAPVPDSKASSHDAPEQTPDGDADAQLMLRFRNGDYDAFESLYSKHRKPLHRYLVRQCRNDAVAEEVFQEVWLSVIRARERYVATAKFTTYLYRIAQNRLIDTSRVRANDGRLHDVYDDEDLDASESARATPQRAPDDSAEQAQLAQALQAAVADLPAEQRDTFLLHEESGLTLEAIAQLMGVGRETVKSRLRYALEKLRSALGAAR